MRQNEALFEYSAAGLPLLARGKVRDILCVGDDHLLMVATDRLSAYDVVLPDPIPGKGEVLTQLSLFWFRMMSNLVDNHLTDISVNDVVSDPQQREILGKRAVVVRRLKPLPVEAVVRGYLIGSGWRDYQKTGRVCGIALPAGMQQAQKLPAPLFTPSSKASAGDHDENIPYADVIDLIGETLAGRVRDLSIAIYQRASDYAEQRGIIVADTKFEFGVDDEGKLYLIDEVLTPDSSRFWPIDEYAVGTSPASFDKQFVRDYLDTLDWDKKPPGPELPEDILKKTSDKYHEAFRRLTGRPLC